MSSPSVPNTGQSVAHLFYKAGSSMDANAFVAAVTSITDDGGQCVTASLLGHKADLGVMIVTKDQWNIRRFQTAVSGCGLELVDSYMSLTELSEYALGIPEEMRNARLDPQLPPPDKPAFCFYPMSKQRGEVNNWYTLDYDRRKELMYEHGASGRTFAGRVVQVISGSTGLDAFEWGVTLFCEHPDDVKEIVYTMRYDTASALYGIFGEFYVGMVTDPAAAIESIRP